MASPVASIIHGRQYLDRVGWNGSESALSSHSLDRPFVRLARTEDLACFLLVVVVISVRAW